MGAGAQQRFDRPQIVTLSTLILGYIGYYLCRQNLAVAFVAMRPELHLDEMDLGWWVTLGTIAYAIGKFASGPIADQFGGRRSFLVGAIGSAIATLAFSASAGMVAFSACWIVNRLFQSVGWAGLVAVVVRRFRIDQQGRAMGLVSLSYQAGGVLATMFAAALLARGSAWQTLFLAPAAVLVVVTGVVVMLVPRDPERVVVPTGQGAPDTGYANAVRALLARPAFWGACALSLVLTLLREIFSVWMPVYFTTLGAAAGAAAVKSVILPLFGCAGTLVASFLADRYGVHRRFHLIAALLVGLALALIALAAVQPFALALGLEPSTLAMIVTGFVGFFLLGPYAMVGGGIVALDFGGVQAAATAAGVLDGVGYLAASLAGLGVAAAVQSVGWGTAFATLVGIVLIAVGVAWGLARGVAGPSHGTLPLDDAELAAAGGDRR